MWAGSLWSAVGSASWGGWEMDLVRSKGEVEVAKSMYDPFISKLVKLRGGLAGALSVLPLSSHASEGQGESGRDRGSSSEAAASWRSRKDLRFSLAE